jgi:hypothetical protein
MIGTSYVIGEVTAAISCNSLQAAFKFFLWGKF